jgi:hypothetical protein
MHPLTARSSVLIIFSALAATMTVRLHSELIRVRYPQGSAHGFLVVKTAEGVIIASGDVIQNVRGERVTSRVTFTFGTDLSTTRSRCFLNTKSFA